MDPQNPVEMEKAFLQGTGVALVTPFDQNLDIDFPAFGRIIDHVVAGGLDYLVVLGTTGEASTLTAEEKTALIRFTVEKAAGRVPVVAGVGGNDTRSVVHAVETLDPTGLAAILSVAPYYNRPTQAGLFQHFQAICQASPLPVIVYNIQSRTGVNILPDTLRDLATTCPAIAGVKEASGNLDQINRVILQKQERFRVISGDDHLTLPLIACGADGVISVTANAFPKAYATMVDRAMAGNLAGARDIHQRLYEFTTAIFAEGSPGGIKEALHHLGLCHPYLRLPLTPPGQPTALRIRELTDLCRLNSLS